MAGDIIGKVQSIQGIVEVRGPDGKLRTLAVGDELHLGDVVLTLGGGKLVVQMLDGSSVAIDSGRTVTMTAELSATHAPGADEAAVAALDPLAAAVLEGRDLDDLLEATAAGPAGGPGGESEGHSFVRLLRIAEPVDPVSGRTTFGTNSDVAGTERNLPIESVPPVATDDNNDNDPVIELGVGLEGTPVGDEPGAATAVGNVLPNDVDPDSPVLTVVAVNGSPANVGQPVTGTYGTIVVNADGSYVYTLDNSDPDADALAAGEPASEAFTYTIADENGLTDSATLTINITGSNDRPEFLSGDDTPATPANQDAYSFQAEEGDEAGTVLGSLASFDVDGGAPQYSIVDGNSNGVFAIDPVTGAISLAVKPDDAEVGTHQLSVQVSDGLGGVDTAVVNITINNVNDPPDARDDNATAAADDALTTAEDTVLTIAPATLLDNDVDPDGDALTIVSVQDAVNGTVALVDGNIVFTPAPDYNGPASFTYTVQDPAGETDTATVGINVTPVNDGPAIDVVAAATFTEGGAAAGDVAFTFTGSDPDTAAADLVYTLTNDSGGYLALGATPGTVVLTAAGAAAINADVPISSLTATVQVSDGALTAQDTDSTTVSAVNDVPVVGTATGTVSEEGLAGANPDSAGNPTDTGNAKTTSGTISIADVDGPVTSVTLTGPTGYTSGGVPITWGFNSTTGRYEGVAGSVLIAALTVSTAGAYSFELFGPIDHATGDGENLLTLSFDVVASDGSGSSAPGTLNIVVEDDSPEISAGNLAIANVQGTFTGAFDFDIGADTQDFADSLQLSWTNARPGYTLSSTPELTTDGNLLYRATYNDGNGIKTFFTITLKDDGTYDFNLVTPDPVISTPSGDLLSTVIQGGSQIPSYTFAASNFGGEFALVVTGYTNNVEDTLTISSTALGVGDNEVRAGQKDEKLRFDIQHVGDSNASLSQLTIHVDGTAGWKPGDKPVVTIFYEGGSSVTVSNVAWGTDQSYTVSFDTTKVVDYVELGPNPSTNNAFKIDGVSLNYTTQTFPDDYQLDFAVTGTDADDDSAPATFSVAVNAVDDSTGEYTISGTTGADAVYGTDGDDTLSGGAGADTFVFRLADAGTTTTPVRDVIADFDPAEGDVLDLRDLLEGAASTDGPLENYLHFQSDGSGGTDVFISSSGDLGTTGADQVINLANVTIADLGGGSTDADIISNMVNNGNLKVDP